MADLEDGEIGDSPTSESNIVPEKAVSNFVSSYNVVERPEYPAVARATMYRSGTPGASSSSSQSDSDHADEDTPMWRQKKEKYFRKQKDSGMVVCSSPTLPEFRKETPQNGNAYKKKNNVWGSVLTEQDLTQTLVKSGGVDASEKINYNERNVESYDFTNKYKDSRPPLAVNDDAMADNQEESHDPFDKVLSSTSKVGARGERSIIDYEDDLLGTNQQQRKRGTKRKGRDERDTERGSGTSIRDRLGPKRVETMSLRGVDLSPDADVDELAKQIAEVLHEAKVELIERIIASMTAPVAIRLLQLTKDIEDGGGMTTFDGSRRRTPGGVYLQLLKQQPEYTSECKKVIFKEDMEDRKNIRKDRRQKAKSRKKQYSGNRNNSNSRSRSRSHDKGGNRQEAMDDGERKPNREVTFADNDKQISSSPELEVQKSKQEMDGAQKPWQHKSKNKSTSRGRRNDRRRKSKSRSKSNTSDDSDDSDGYSNRRNPGQKEAFNFEDELAAAKKIILAKSTASVEKEHIEQVEMEADKVEVKEAELVQEDMNDLNEEEAHVVDIQLG